MYDLKRLATWMIIGLLFISATACGTLTVAVEQTPTPELALTATVAALATNNAWLGTQIALPTLTPKPPPIIETQIPTVTVTAATPKFSNLRFSTQPDAIDSQHFYVAGTGRIYAVFDYTDMDSTMTVRRVWYRNGAEWITREDKWSFDKYGSAGTIKDISVFDEAIGLQPGEYSLSLYIDGTLQDFGEGSSNLEKSSFWIFPSDVQSAISSPDGSLSARVQRGGHLIIESQDGRDRELVVTQEISGIAWFPDSRHLVYTDRDRSKQVNATEDWGITHKLWALDIETGERHLIGTSGENFHHPVISPNGRYIAVLAGNTFGDACLASPTLSILELDSELRRQAVYVISDFSGLPYSSPGNYGIYPTDHTSPGHWEGDQSFVTSLWWVCLTADNSPNGTYLLDLGKREAQRIGS